MTTVVSVQDAQSTLSQLIEQLAPGDEVVLTRNGQTVARLIGEGTPHGGGPRAGFGALKGMITYMADDFDAPLEDMKEYMQ